MNCFEIGCIAKARAIEKGKLSILLISPRTHNFYSDWSVPPIGPAYVSAALKRHKKTVFTLNLEKEEGSIADIVQNAIKEWDIDIIGFGALIVNWRQAEEAFQAAKECKETIITYLGGGSMTCSPTEMMELIPEVGIGMIGEGEITACEMMDTLEQGGDLKNVDGLVLREPNGDLHYNAPREIIRELDSLPWPDWDGFKFFDQEPAGDFPNRLVCAPLVTSRGCPFRCTFCSKPTGTAHHQRSMDSIFAEVDHLVQTYGINRLFIDDDVFALPIWNQDAGQESGRKYKSRLEEFCDKIKPYSVEWLLYLRVGEYMTDELLSLMKASGCVEVFYGIESGDDTVLHSMHKGITAAVIEDTVRRTHAAGLGCSGTFIFGDPAETLDTVERTFAFSDRLSDQFTNMSFTPIILFPGSSLYKKAVMEGKITDRVEFIRNGLPFTNLTSMSEEEYRELIRERIPAQRVKRMICEETSHRPQKLMIDYNKKALYINHVCRRCGSSSEIYLRPESLTDHTYHLCPKCKQRVDYIVMKLYAQLVDQYVEELLQDGQTVLWGAGTIYRYYQAFSGVLGKLPYLLTDSNLDLQEHGVAGHEVVPPAKLREKGICRAIIMAWYNYSPIVDDIHKNYPEIEEVYDFRELVFHNKQSADKRHL